MTASKRKTLITGMLGNGLEWYDYALYGHMSVIIAKLFFPAADESTSLILTFLTFAVGFISRPLGAIFFGRFGDTYGRKKALTASMILMAIPTGCIGLLPPYASIGIAAPILLLLIRILQGISLGGVFSGSMSYVVEHAAPDRRGRAGGFILLSLVIGFLTGSLVSTITASLTTPEQFLDWGWRLPFFLGIGIGFIGYYIRNHGEESPVYEQAKRDGTLSKTPVRDATLRHPGQMLRACLIYLFIAVPFYTVSIYLIAYSKTHLGLSAPQALSINTIALACMLLTLYPSAWASDRIGRKPVMLSALILTVLLAYPLIQLMQGGVYTHVLIAQIIFGLLLGYYQGPMPALLVELFPTSIRNTGMALVANICAMIGGFAPAIAEGLIKLTGNPVSITWIFITTGALAALGFIHLQDRWREPLR